jgi:hypothetical protein
VACPSGGSAPLVDSGANLKFVQCYSDDVVVTWTAFADINLSGYRITAYLDSGCTSGAIDHGLTGSSSPSDTANSTVSACSSETISVP